jgi:hypothetical protein
MEKKRPKSAFVIPPGEEEEDENTVKKSPQAWTGLDVPSNVADRLSPEKEHALLTLDAVIQNAEESMGTYIYILDLMCLAKYFFL